MGLPLLHTPAGPRSTSQTAHAKLFARSLADASPHTRRVWLVDESHSSALADMHMASSSVAVARQPGLRDAVAAALILSRFFTADAPPQRVAPSAAARARSRRAHAAPLAGSLARLDARAGGVRLRSVCDAMDAAERPAAGAPAPPRKAVSVDILRRRGGAAPGRRERFWGGDGDVAPPAGAEGGLTTETAA